jgi:hypothetical protein
VSVVAIGKAAIVRDRRQSFIDAIAQSFERYVADHGEEPDAIVYALAGVKQPSRTGWVIDGNSKDGATSLLCLAAAHLSREAMQEREWAE